MIKTNFFKPNKCKLLLFIFFLLLLPGYYMSSPGFSLGMDGGGGFFILTTPILEIINFIIDSSFGYAFPVFLPLLINIPISYFLSCFVANFCKKN